MIIGLNALWLKWIKAIDIKSYEWPWDDDQWVSELPKNIIKMWMDPETPRGFMIYRFMDIRDLIPKLEGSVVHISKLAVHPNFRNQGIGAALLADLVTTAKLQKVTRLVVFLHEENEIGIRWTTNDRRGFKAHGVHRELFPDKRDGYGFIKELL